MGSEWKIGEQLTNMRNYGVRMENLGTVSKREKF